MLLDNPIPTSDGLTVGHQCKINGRGKPFSARTRVFGQSLTGLPLMQRPLNFKPEQRANLLVMAIMG